MIKNVVKTFSDKSKIGYDQGSFDSWCIYIEPPDGFRKPPKDVEYFSRLENYGEKYGVEKVYNDLLEIFNFTGTEVKESQLSRITEISREYGDDMLDVDKDYTTIYLGMIAENRKENTVLGKNIKMLGIYQTLFEGDHPETNAIQLTEDEVRRGIRKSAKRAANWSKKRPGETRPSSRIMAECKRIGTYIRNFRNTG